MQTFVLPSTRSARCSSGDCTVPPTTCWGAINVWSLMWTNPNWSLRISTQIQLITSPLDQSHLQQVAIGPDWIKTCYRPRPRKRCATEHGNLHHNPSQLHICRWERVWLICSPLVINDRTGTLFNQAQRNSNHHLVGGRSRLGWSRLKLVATSSG